MFQMSSPSLSKLLNDVLCAVTTVLILCVHASAIVLADEKPGEIRIDGVFGTDDRELVNSLAPPWNAVGKINIKGYRKRQHCTATLIEPNKVVTAAHCLRDNQTGSPFHTDRIHFLAGVQRGDFLEHATAACVHFLNLESASLSPADDVAMVVLSKELTIAPAPIAVINSVHRSLNLVHAGYTKDRPHSLAADSTCELKSRQGNLWLTDCDTNFGASGGPVFAKNDNQLTLAAIMVGYSKDKYSIAIPSTAWNFPSAPQACD